MQLEHFSYLALALSSSVAAGIPGSKLSDRETPCIALNDCGGYGHLTSHSSSTVAPPPSSTSESSSATAQPTVESSPNMPIKKGYVAFGDSYAAGIGTGSTEGSGCRQGEFSYPKQIASRAPRGIDFQNLPCSGAVVEDLVKGGGQIDQWKNPGNADIATLSIGGNDIGFYDILTACVLRVGQFWAGDCGQEMQRARDKILDWHLGSEINSALNRMLTKSGRDDFKIYLTGYPGFFDPDTDYCDYSTFYFWQPGHHGFHHQGNWAYLYKSLRLDLNNLVQLLNNLLLHTAAGLNHQHGRERVVFVDPTPGYEGHRFCERGVNDPDSNHMDTYLFLSAWPDNSLPGAANSRRGESLEEGNSTALPEPEEACSNMNSTTDWAVRMQCDISIAVANATISNKTVHDLAPGAPNQWSAPPPSSSWTWTLTSANGSAKWAGFKAPSDATLNGPDESKFSIPLSDLLGNWNQTVLVDNTTVPNTGDPPISALSIIRADQKAITDKNYTAVEVSWWIPTRDAKTFHPRTLGHKVYADAISQVW